MIELERDKKEIQFRESRDSRKELDRKSTDSSFKMNSIVRNAREDNLNFNLNQIPSLPSTQSVRTNGIASRTTQLTPIKNDSYEKPRQEVIFGGEAKRK